MRKWMRDRLKRRKEKAEKTQPAESKPAPLQPDFYGDEPASQPETAVVAESAAAPEEEIAEPIAEPTPGEEQGSLASSNGDTRPRKRRRGRGGRRRGATASQPTRPVAPPPAEPASIPESDNAEAGTPGVVPAPPARASKGIVVLAIGLPGSGKSAWFKRHNISPLSSDLLRALLFDDATEQRFQDLVFSNLRSMLKARLIARRPMNYVDATNLTPHDRQGWIKLAKDYHYEVQAVFFDVPVEVCLQRNARRARVVPEDAMHRMAAKLKPPTFEEGFTKITVVRVKHKE